MLTVVWSPTKGQAGCSTALCALAYYTARNLKLGERALIMRTKLKNSGLVEIMDAKHFGLSTSVYVHDFQMTLSDATGDRNIDRLLMAYAAGFQLMDTLEANTIKLDSKLYVLEGSRSNNRSIYEKEMTSTIEKILKVANICFTQVFVEAEDGDSPVNHLLFQHADRIIVCIPQNTFALRTLLPYKLPCEKLAYLIGNYDEESILTARNLSKQLKTDSPVEGLPYMTGIKNAYSAGNLKKEFETIFSSEYDDLGPRLKEVLGTNAV